jgi:hypothetical protein
MTLTGMSSAECELAFVDFQSLASRVDGGIPSLAVAPDGPENRPLVLASAASMISRSLRGSDETGSKQPMSDVIS